MATIKYGTLELFPSPILGISVKSNFFGADIRFSRTKTYSLKGTLLSNILSGVSGITTQHNDLITGFQQNYQPFYVDGTLVGHPQVKVLSFENGGFVQKNGYSIDLEFLESGSPFQITGTNYGFTGVSGLFHNIESLSESLDYNTDFKTFGYTHSIDIQYRTGVGINPLLNAKLISSGLINNKVPFPFVTSGGPSGNKFYTERENTFDGRYSVTETFEGTTGNNVFDHQFGIRLQLQENGSTLVTQEGIIKGYDPNKYNNAKSGYAIVRTGIYESCSGFYFREYGTSDLHTTFLTDSRVDNINLGTIEYGRVFTDELQISDSPATRWQYSNQIVFDGNYIEASEQGNIQGLAHISTRFSTATSKFTSISGTIPTRVAAEVTLRGYTGPLFLIGREKSSNSFDGVIDYTYVYSNNPNFSPTSKIKFYSVDIEDVGVTHDVVAFNVVNQRTVVQSLGATTAGQRTTSVDAQGFRSATKSDLTTFAATKYSIPTSVDTFLASVQLNFSPQDVRLRSSVTYIHGGTKSSTDLRI